MLRILYSELAKERLYIRVAGDLIHTCLCHAFGSRAVVSSKYRIKLKFETN